MGAKSILAMRQLEDGKAFVTPAILDVTDIAAQLPDEEYFGPLSQIIRYHDFDEAMQIANRTQYGLSASLLAVAALLLLIVLWPSVKKKREEAFVED